jgi:hypothetical protein
VFGTIPATSEYLGGSGLDLLRTSSVSEHADSGECATLRLLVSSLIEAGEPQHRLPVQLHLIEIRRNSVRWNRQ